MKTVKKNSTENCHFYSCEKSLYIAWLCFRNATDRCLENQVTLKLLEIHDIRILHYTRHRDIIMYMYVVLTQMLCVYLHVVSVTEQAGLSLTWQ